MKENWLKAFCVYVFVIITYLPTGLLRMYECDDSHPIFFYVISYIS